jgi:uncharacterized DUF497 family protein
VDIRGSALKHGVAAEDIRHALRQPMAQLDGDEGRTLVLGPDRAGRLLELVVMDRDSEAARVIHAMPMRSKFRRYLER